MRAHAVAVVVMSLTTAGCWNQRDAAAPGPVFAPVWSDAGGPTAARRDAAPPAARDAGRASADGGRGADASATEDDAGANTVQCGDERCPAGDGLWTGCCLADAACGWIVMGSFPFLERLPERCHAFEQPGELDEACADITIPFSMAGIPLVSFEGCCTDEALCGAIIHAGSGCVAMQDITDRADAPCGP